MIGLFFSAPFQSAPADGAASAIGGAGQEYDGVILPEDELRGAGADVLPAGVRIESNHVRRNADRLVFGLNHNWIWSNEFIMEPGDEASGPVISGEFVDTLRGLPMPLNRMSGATSQRFQWKKAIGPMAGRSEQKLAPHVPSKKLALGPVEWVQSTLKIDPEARFVWSFNFLQDSPADHADLVEFLTGDPATSEWARRRVELGLTDPVPVVMWQLGSELDWGNHAMSLDDYIARCRETIRAVRGVSPDAKFTANAATAPWNPNLRDFREARGGWQYWHRAVLRELGDEIDYIALHPYYYGMATSAIEVYMDEITRDILEITGSDRIKLHISEHARWPARPREAGVHWRENWYQTHSLEGTLATAQFLVRLLNRPDVAAANYHSLSAGPWGLIYRDDESGALYRTGLVELFRLFAEVPGRGVVKTTVTGDRTNVTAGDLSFTAAALRTEYGYELFLVNRDPGTARLCLFETDSPLYLTAVSTLTADDWNAYNTAAKEAIRVETEILEPTPVLRELKIPARSMVRLTLGEKK